MRLAQIALLTMMAAGLAGCNDALESVDVSHVRNKVEQPLPDRIIAEMRKKGMDKTSPIAIRIFKEEGVLEIWKAKTDNRFDKIADYKICAWSGRLGPKIKEGDRQAPEGFYPLSPAHLNPNSKYYLAINTGYPNRFDAANRRNGTNLMIHGACSSSGCYSMTDAQILEIYAFARDAFKGGQTSVQLQAFPFRMTADNMARHRTSPHFEFWKMLKVGYDHFELTKRPPEVNVCNKGYVFNQMAGDGKAFNPTAACPPMSTPPALAAALSSYNKKFDADYAKALRKYDGKIWYDPTEAERKAVVASLRKGKELAFAPTGSSLDAGRLMDESEYAEKVQAQMAAAAAKAEAAKAPKGPAAAPLTAATTVPVPTPNPSAPAAVATAEEAPAKKPFWKLW